MADLTKLTIADAEVSVRTTALVKTKFPGATLADLMKLSVSELKAAGFSRKSVNELIEVLAEVKNLPDPAPPPPAPFQQRVVDWLLACFGTGAAGDLVERGDRLVEEIFELLQSKGYDPSRIAMLRDYVWGRPVGEPHQEIGGVMITLAGYCSAAGLDMTKAGEDELERVWTKVDVIRQKQLDKPHGSPLPIAVEQDDTARDAARWRALMSCPRIRMYGSAGVDPRTGERTEGSYVHFGADFWSTMGVDYDPTKDSQNNREWGVFAMTALADGILDEQAIPKAKTTD